MSPWKWTLGRGHSQGIPQTYAAPHVSVCVEHRRRRRDDFMNTQFSFVELGFLWKYGVKSSQIAPEVTVGKLCFTKTVVNLLIMIHITFTAKGSHH